MDQADAMSTSGYVPPVADVALAPLLIRRTGQTALGALVLAIASLWLVAVLDGVLAGNPAIVPGLGASGAYFAGAVGTALAVLSLHWIVRRRTVVIDRGMLCVTERSLLGAHTWREPLSNYREIRAIREQRPHRYGVRTFYVVQLWHPQPAKRVELACGKDPVALEARARGEARRFGLPLSCQGHETTAGNRLESRGEVVEVAAPGRPVSAR